jgi:hypothetical protein
LTTYRNDPFGDLGDDESSVQSTRPLPSFGGREDCPLGWFAALSRATPERALS